MKLILLGLCTLSIPLMVGCSHKEYTAESSTKECNIHRTYNGHKQRFHFEYYVNGCDMSGRWGAPTGYWEDIKGGE